LGILDGLDREMDRVLSFIRARVNSEEDAWDILQDVFLAFYRRWNIGEVIEDALAWLFRTARNRIIDLYRSRGRHEVSLEELQSSRHDPDGFRELIDTGTATPEEEHYRRELREMLLKVISELPDEQRQVFLLTELEGMKYSEISEMTGVPLNTLLSRKRYAIMKIREKVPDVAGYPERQG
jgi:RNA polymerase sigma factor (sigma-70 family)